MKTFKQITIKKIIKPGQLVTFNNIVYRCRKRPTLAPWDQCYECALYTECAKLCLPFSCDYYTNFIRVYPK